MAAEQAKTPLERKLEEYRAQQDVSPETVDKFSWVHGDLIDNANVPPQKKSLVDKAAPHARDRCMASGCTKHPGVECKWAEGMAHAWFCQMHFDAWVAESPLHEPDCQRKVTGGAVGKKYGDPA